jgi:putative hemolysin
MDQTAFWLWFLVAFAGLLLSALCSGLETGLYTINRVRLAVLAGRGSRTARLLEAELARPGRLLTTLLIGNNTANYMGSLGVVAMLGLAGLGDTQAIIADTIILVPILFIFAETLPKDLFRTNTDKWTYHLVKPLRFVRILLSIIGLVPFVAGIADLVQRVLGGKNGSELAGRHRMAELLREGVGAGVLSTSQGALLDRVVELRDRTVRSELVGWRRVATIPLSSNRLDRERILRSKPLSRWPVVDRDGRVAGILHAIDAVAAPEKTTQELLRPATVIEPDVTTLEALKKLQNARVQLAIVGVRDGDGGSRFRPVGVVTIKDLVEPLIGPVHDW